MTIYDRLRIYVQVNLIKYIVSNLWNIAVYFDNLQFSSYHSCWIMSNAVSMVTYCTYQLNAATFQEGSHLVLCCYECKMSSPSFICSIWQLSCLTNMAHVYLFYLNIIWWLNHWKEELYNIQNRAFLFIFNFMIWLVWYSRLLLYILRIPQLVTIP